MHVELQRLVVETMVVRVEGLTQLIERSDLEAAVDQLQQAIGPTGEPTVVEVPSMCLANLLLTMGAAAETEEPGRLLPGPRLSAVVLALGDLDTLGRADL